jgi:hypothetical protein
LPERIGHSRPPAWLVREAQGIEQLVQHAERLVAQLAPDPRFDPPRCLALCREELDRAAGRLDDFLPAVVGGGREGDVAARDDASR